MTDEKKPRTARKPAAPKPAAVAPVVADDSTRRTTAGAWAMYKRRQITEDQPVEIIERSRNDGVLRCAALAWRRDDVASASCK